jgi:hypothetical protein
MQFSKGRFKAENVDDPFISSSVIFETDVVLQVRIPMHGGCAWLAIMLVDMMVVIAPAA